MEKIKYHEKGCLLCGRPIRYEAQAIVKTCALCGKTIQANTACEAGHYVCDACHGSGLARALSFLRSSKEKDPMRLFLQAVKLEGVHLHGPEHHSLVPCVLLTAYHNCGGRIPVSGEEMSLDAALEETILRGRQVPGGFCGFWGVCGAAVGAGIYASMVAGSGPLNAEAWSIPQRLTARCLDRMADIGGPRCCKRTGRNAVETAVQFTEEHFGIEMTMERAVCTYSEQNRECIRERCPYFGSQT